MRIDGVDYTINWEDFTVGSSFFIPCVGVTEAKDRIERKMKRLNYNVIVKIVIEDGIRGLRVWRIKRRIDPAI
jgi:hypothetical protein